MTKNKALKAAIKSNHSLIKNYSYQKGAVGLNFSLNVKNKTDLADFVELMANATEEVTEDINNLNK